MIYTQEEIATMVAKKCEEALAPLDAQAQPSEPTPDPEEAREAEFKAQLAEMKEMLIKSGRIKA